ncbi:hypothetical protein AMTRI_Chr12g267000 [Amborella trichopoda]|uniref:Ubiquitin carboxyl-terminal hydrolase 26 n=1 Tax=Amborella trichopoda TaxID=13333 RepID=W1NUY6_AMBTC|nr:ubiquitin carboxyl-terminal hydrolase 26 [Amborella trichopoda]XP_020518816.1 ubiquitin carboxyl-terminal hydrolase 26 [Amborella trichopoda]ERM99417.1 hypothetical protein AMTR_s00131p00065190 [Amborella trichopoda]|eukprot:XP_006836564.1 ubiquitin carboxyl-terminal hydrolase 26 [Amborella trichopoda]
MSGATTRGKNKKQKLHSEDTGSEILRKINSTGEVTQDDIRVLYQIEKPICQGCRVNTKDSPNCFCGLIPPPSGSRKTGLWQRLSDHILALGPDPCKDFRDSKVPAGLTNLGATCYANSILQCLYMNTAFRAGIFSVELDLLKQHPVLYELSRLFAQLHSSKRAAVDSAAFIKTLELDNGVQQDSHEFFTLLLSLLESCLGHSKVPKARTVVQDLFRGSISHVTRCSLCGKDSESSSKMEDFLGLELNIKGLNNLDKSLDDYFSMEELHGENQYFCESCQSRVDATRCIKLRTLPSVLNFQLKRYIFLPKTTTRKKITSKFAFPKYLNMANRLSDTSQSGNLMYDLSAILMHKGTAVNSGHYVAHIKEEGSGIWWEFDDEHVSKLGLHPFGEESSNSSDVPEEVVQPDFSDENIIQLPLLDDVYSSADSYMLMYSRRNNRNDGDTPPAGADVECKDFDGTAMSQVDGSSLPCHLSGEMEELNKQFEYTCKEYRIKQENEMRKIKERKNEVRSILTEAPVPSIDNSYCWISVDWLRHWADDINPLCIDNSSILCSHGKLPISKISCAKRISEAAWTKLLSKYGGGLTLSGSDYCVDCMRDFAKSVVSADNYRDRRATMKELAESVLAGKYFEGPLYYVSRSWLLQWIRRKNVDSPCDGDSGPTAALRCSHGGLMPEKAGTKRQLIPASLWFFFLENAKEVEPEDSLRHTAFHSNTEDCTTCSMELTEVACLEDHLKAVKLEQRQKHEQLYLGKSIPIFPYQRYYLLPSSWLSRWRGYVSASGKNLIAAAEPGSLEGGIDMLKCEKHSRLLQRPVELVQKRGDFVQKVSNAEGLTMISESDWKLFCEDWEVPEEKGIYAEVDFTNCTSNESVGFCSEMPISEADMDIPKSFEPKKPVVKTYPEICEECIGEKECCDLMQKLNYQNEDIRVHLVHGKEPPMSLLVASGGNSEPDRRCSKRSRRTSAGESVNLKVSGSTSVYQLKMMIWESLGVVKENQSLHKGTMEISDESLTLADLNILPGDALWVTDTQVHDDRDIAEELSQEKLEPQPMEEGFKGTLLTSSSLPRDS